MRVLLDDLTWEDRRGVKKCRECRVYDSSVFLCGWHENVVAAVRAVARVAGRSRSAPPRTENP